MIAIELLKSCFKVLNCSHTGYAKQLRWGKNAKHLRIQNIKSIGLKTVSYRSDWIDILKLIESMCRSSIRFSLLNTKIPLE